MIFIHEQAEELLAQVLSAPEDAANAKRAIHIEIHSAPPLISLPCTTLIDGLVATLSESDVRVFICEDNDMILLGKDLSTQVFLNIRDLVTTWMSATEITGNCSFYEKGVNWYQFIVLSEEKIAAIHHKQEQATALKQEKKKKMAREHALKQRIPQELIDSIQSRKEGRNKLSILIVEDDPFSRTLVRNSLKKDYNVISAEDAYHAIGFYAEKAPNIVFLDIGLPDANGHETLERILEIDPKAFIVMLSGNGDRDTVLQAVRAGAKGFIGKPFTKEKLLQYIEMAEQINSAA